MKLSERLCFWAAMLALSLLALQPFWTHAYPGLVDYPNHLARVHLLTGAVPEGWQQFYAVNPLLIPNLALDELTVHWVSWGLSPNDALRLFAALALVLPVWGAVMLAWAVNRTPPWWALIIFSLAFHRYFIWGFLNYAFALGLALCLVAGWVRWRHEARGAQALALLLGASMLLLAIVFSHLMGLGVALCTLAMYELGRLMERRAGPDAWWRAATVLALASAPALAVYVFAFDHAGSGSYYYGDFVRSKLSGLASPFVSYGWPAGALVALLFILTLALAGGRGLWRHKAWPWSSALPVGAMWVLFLALPSAMMGSDFLDKRLFVVVLLLALGFVSLRTPARRVAIVMFVLSLTGMVVKSWEINRAWSEHTQAMTAIRQTLQRVPLHARVGSHSFSDSSLMEFPPLRHAVMWALIDRAAMVQTLFAAPFNKESVAYRPPVNFKRPLDAAGVTPSSPIDWTRTCKDQDFVLITHTTVKPEPPACMSLVAQGPHHQLFEVVRAHPGGPDPSPPAP